MRQPYDRSCIRPEEDLINHLIFLGILIAGLCLNFSANATEALKVPYDSIIGLYECIGRWPDSNEAYSGRVEISHASEGVKVIRDLKGQRVEARGQFRTATPDEVQVLKVNFRQNGIDYEETCMLSTDLDNYPRMTCYLYSPKTKEVGLEALFPDHGQLKRD